MRMLSKIAALLLASVWCSTLVAQDNNPADDHEGVYRLNPRADGSDVVLVPSDEIKPGYTYNYYSPILKSRAWGFATEDHSFEYAFGEGTIIPTSRFDLRLSEEAKLEILERRVPRLKQDLEGLGRSPALQLNASSDWELLSYTTSARVFDLLTSERWEWHGSRCVGVVSVYGNLWQIVNGKYVPLMMGWAVCR